MLQLIKGNIFDSKCDLLIIPCNNMGGMTLSVEAQIEKHGIPRIDGIINPGDVAFIDDSKSAYTHIIGYAASVDTTRSKNSLILIEQIMGKIREYCIAHSLSKINIPLLGTGAGRVGIKESFEVMRKCMENEPNIQLYIHAYTDDVYEILREGAGKKFISPIIKTPRVFISYTATNDTHMRQWVRQLTDKLRKDGVDARIDMYHLSPGHDLPQWMTNEVLMADQVLLICDEKYAMKADNRTGGVGWETMIIQGDMLSQHGKNKYIAIGKGKNFDQSLPVYVRSRFSLNWSKDEQPTEEDYKELLLYLFDCELAPPLGKVPHYISERLKGAAAEPSII